MTDDNSADRNARIEAFLAEARNAIVIGRRADGSVHATPNWFLYQDGCFRISTTRTRAKYRIFRRDPFVHLVVDDATGFRYVALDGTVDIHEDVDAGLPFFQALRLKHGRDAHDLDALRAEMVRDERVLLVVTPTLAPDGWRSAGF